MKLDLAIPLCATIDGTLTFINCVLFHLRSQSDIEWFIIPFILSHLLDASTNLTYIETKQWFAKALWTSNADEAGTLMKHPADSSILLHYCLRIMSTLAPVYIGWLVRTIELKTSSVFDHFSYTSLISDHLLHHPVTCHYDYILFNLTFVDDICFLNWRSDLVITRDDI